MALLDLFRIGRTAEHCAGILHVDVIGGVDDDLSIRRRTQIVEHFAELVVGHRDDHNLGAFHRLGVGACGVSAGGLCRRLGMLRAGGTERDFMARPHG